MTINCSKKKKEKQYFKMSKQQNSDSNSLEKLNAEVCYIIYLYIYMFAFKTSWIQFLFSDFELSNSSLFYLINKFCIEY